jgi:hypothetical protein
VPGNALPCFVCCSARVVEFVRLEGVGVAVAHSISHGVFATKLRIFEADMAMSLYLAAAQKLIPNANSAIKFHPDELGKTYNAT